MLRIGVLYESVDRGVNDAPGVVVVWKIFEKDTHQLNDLLLCNRLKLTTAHSIFEIGKQAYKLNCSMTVVLTEARISGIAALSVEFYC